MAKLVYFTFLSLQVWAKFRRGYIQFPDFCSILINVNCQNSKNSDDIDMKLAPVTKIDKRNKVTLKKFDDDVMSNYIHVRYIFINSNLLTYKS